MSPVTSITRLRHPARHKPSPQSPNAARQIMVLPAPKQGRRPARKTLAPHSMAFAAQLAAGTPRRGLRAAPAEQARIYAIYERTQTRPPLSGQRLRLTA